MPHLLLILKKGFVYCYYVFIGGKYFTIIRLGLENVLILRIILDKITYVGRVCISLFFNFIPVN